MLESRLLVLLVAIAPLMFGGCASLQEEVGGYPADTAILVDGVAYQINTTKCAAIKSVGQDGALDCHDAGGMKSASITPVSEWRRNYLKEKLGFEWASPEHQAFLFHYFHQGGMEQSVKGIQGTLQQSIGILSTAKNLIASSEKSRDIAVQGAQKRLEGVTAYMSGGMPAWQAHQQKTIQWHLENARFFTNQINKTSPNFLKD